MMNYQEIDELTHNINSLSLKYRYNISLLFFIESPQPFKSIDPLCINSTKKENPRQRQSSGFLFHKGNNHF